MNPISDRCTGGLVRRPAVLAGLMLALGLGCASAAGAADDTDLWAVYDQSLKGAKYIDLTHTITPNVPVWSGFGPSKFEPAIDPKTGQAYSYAKDGFEAMHYNLMTDQLGTQLDPPAHWAPEYPAIDELPPTFAMRPLVVIPIVEQVKRDPGYHLQVADIQAFEREHGPLPAGSVVFVRSDWSKDWPDPALSTRTPFPGVSLDALKFLHLERHILMHGHEPLDTDTTPTLEGEAWLMHNGYTQAEGVANLDKVSPTGCPWSRSAIRSSRAELVAMLGISRFARPPGHRASALAKSRTHRCQSRKSRCIGTKPPEHVFGDGNMAKSG